MTCRCSWSRILTALLVLSMTTSAWAQRPPASKVEILEPAAGQELTGGVDVRIKITPPEGGQMPALVRVGLGGPPWEPMNRVEKTNEWTAPLDTTMAPNGSQRLAVVTSETRARAAVEVKLENPLEIFFADLHSHTSYSDGTLLPSDAHCYAREEAKLAVFSLTDHLEYVDDAEWLDSREVAWDANQDGEFVAIPGLEWTKKWGHLNIFDPKTRHWPADPQEFYAALAAAGVVAKFNHPGDGTKSHAGLAYSEVGDKAIQLTEVRRDVEEKAFIRALNNGWHIAPEGSDDTHRPNWGNCGTWTGILAPGLSKRNVLDALANRRCYATRDRNCRLHFTANGAVAGSIVEGPIQTVQVSV
ncbi:MAG: CehA/McbA family metallohydrolase, partial [Planctomycetes bacterium]|nr:CehA/McbA family metallohydrolase [Planctomycetota bacterium]